jgi:multidrug resistance efflux pump
MVYRIARSLGIIFKASKTVKMTPSFLFGYALHTGKWQNVKFLFCLAVVSVTGSCGKKQETIRPVQGDITEAVYATGKVLAKNQYTVFPVVSGVLMRSLKEPGDSVHVGDTLFVIDDLTSRLNKEQAKSVLEYNRESGRYSSARMEEAELSYAAAVEKFHFDSSLFVRQKRLWENGIGSRLELEQRELGYQSSMKQVESARARIDQLKLQLAHEIDRAEIGYRISSKSSSDFVITSKLDGIVYDVRRELNEFVTPQTPLAVVGNSDQFYLELQVDEYDIVKVAPGQKVLVSMDAHRGEVFEALVTSVHPIMDELTRSFLIKSEFTKAPATLYPNITVEGNIVLQQKKDVLLVPRRYVEDDRYVYIKENERQEIVSGLRNYDQIEIVSGLDLNQELFLPPVK